ncbi:MAG: MMPL family transporter [Pirellulales bacterium]
MTLSGPQWMRGRNLALIAATIIVLAAWNQAGRLALDWKLDRMFPTGEPLVASYHRLEKNFGGNEIVLAVYRDDTLWAEDGSGVDRLAKISDELQHVSGVKAVLSLAELHRILETLDAPTALLAPQSNKSPLLDLDNKPAQAFAEVFEGYTHRRGSPIVAVACMLEPLAGERKNHRQTIADLRAVMSRLPEPARDGLLTGEPVMVTDGFVMVEQDGTRLGIVSTVLLACVLLIVFRSIRWTLIPLVVVHWSIIVTKAILAWMQLELTMVSSMLTAIITVIGVATTMHLLLKYQQLRSQGLDPEAAIKRTFRELAAPVAWACITDAVGFASLCIAEVGPVRDFGLMMAIGSLVVLCAIALIVPGAAVIGGWDLGAHIPPFDFTLRVLLRKLLFEVLERRSLGVLILIVLSVLGIWGSERMTVETDFTKNFRQGSPLVQGYRVVESELGGAGVWDITLPAPQAITADYLKDVRTLEERLRTLKTGKQQDGIGLTKVLSMADADQAAATNPLFAILPVTARLEGMRRTMPVFSQALLTDADPNRTLRYLRIMLRSSEQVPAQQKTELVSLVQHEVDTYTTSDAWRQHFKNTEVTDNDQLRGEVTGYYVMLGRLVSSVLSDQWKCFLLATLGILITMLLAVRSLKFSLAALVPNALPVFIVLGAMGWMGMRVNMGAAMIAAVSMGLSIDSSIHYLMHMQGLIRQGKPAVKAMRSAQEDVGLALVLATSALMAGFLSLCVSQFVPTIVFGVLVTLTMLGGLAGNLVMLPLLIAERPKKK